MNTSQQQNTGSPLDALAAIGIRVREGELFELVSDETLRKVRRVVTEAVEALPICHDWQFYSSLHHQASETGETIWRCRVGRAPGWPYPMRLVPLGSTVIVAHDIVDAEQED